MASPRTMQSPPKPRRSRRKTLTKSLSNLTSSFTGQGREVGTSESRPPSMPSLDLDSRCAKPKSYLEPIPMPSRRNTGLRMSSGGNLASYSHSVGSCGSSADAANLVAEEFFAGNSSKDNGSVVESSHFAEFRVSVLPPLPDEDDDNGGEPMGKFDVDNREMNENKSEKNGASISPTTVSTCISLSRIVTPSSNYKYSEKPFSIKSSSIEASMSTSAYLQECFSTATEAPNLMDQNKFNAVPEITKSDFIIDKHLGKGVFSDVFEVVSEGNFDNGNKTPAENQLDLNSLSDLRYGTSPKKQPNVPQHQGQARRMPSRAQRSTLASSMTAISVSSLARPSSHRSKVYAMKCLRPQIRSDADRFIIGAEDLIHETAMLADSDHPNIIKIHGRAAGDLALCGYFILLDKLNETLTDRIEAWKEDSERIANGPGMEQLVVADKIADAMEYLHSKNVVFRDLKPDNIGFDSNGELKLFNFGFSIKLSVEEEEESNYDPDGLLLNYMAPEVGLGLSDPGTFSDVYSFGILLWQLCSLMEPFAFIQTAEEFQQSVFIEGNRPPVLSCCPASIIDLVQRCWDASPKKRPTMWKVKSLLNTTVKDMSSAIPEVKYFHKKPNQARATYARFSLPLLETTSKN